MAPISRSSATDLLNLSLTSLLSEEPFETFMTYPTDADITHRMRKLPNLDHSFDKQKYEICASNVCYSIQ